MLQGGLYAPTREVFNLRWAIFNCSNLSTGLDYFVMETAGVVGHLQTGTWLELVLCEDAEATIRGLEFYRRRRYKSDPAWPEHGARWTNQCNRAKRRALQMIQSVGRKAA